MNNDVLRSGLLQQPCYGARVESESHCYGDCQGQGTRVSGKSRRKKTDFFI